MPKKALQRRRLPLRIAFIGSKGIPAHSGGVERHVHELATRLGRKGIAVTVYARRWYTKSRDTLHGNVAVRHLFSFRTKHLDAISHSLVALMDAMIAKNDIIHIHGIGPALLTPIARLLSNARIVVTLHCQDYYHQKWGPFARIALRMGEWMAVRFSHELIVVSRELQRHIWGTYHRSAEYIPNGATLPLPDPSYRKQLQRLQVLPGYLLYVGRLIPHKGVHVLVEAYRLLNVSIPLLIVGAGSHTDEYVRSLKRFASPVPNIRFLGERTGKQLDALYRGARLVIQPSQSEGMSLALLEAMSYAKTVVASAIPENEEVMSNPDFLFYPTDPHHLAVVLERALHRRAECAREGRLNRSVVRSLYHWDGIARDTVKVYHRLFQDVSKESPVELVALPVRPIQH